MRAFMVLACVALAYGRPEPPVGYSYSAPARHAAPSGSYGAPALGGRVSLGGHSSGGVSLSSHSFGGGHSSGGLSLGGHSSGGSSFGGHSSGASSFGGHSSGGISLGSSGFGGDSGFGGGYAGGYSGAPLVQKHIYVHVPPPEPQEHKAPRIHQVAAPQKHYKIIFIKAPAPPAPTAPVIPVQPQNEEKTLVYVLVKKPEEQPDIVIPTPAPTQPSKPEVYFIKYQTQKESGGASIGGGAGIGGSGIGGSGIGGGDLGGGVSLGSGAGSGSHGGVEIASDFGTSGGDDSGSDAGHGGASTQYGPPGHVAGPLH
ncbi:hypothetical protein O0L34_g2585 [Tuta absoluta]|nr:hypothetical protein O0L34_g2585 [Tuta absoluta]